MKYYAAIKNANNLFSEKMSASKLCITKAHKKVFREMHIKTGNELLWLHIP